MSLLLDFLTLDFIFSLLLFKYDSYLICLMSLSFSAGSFPHIVVGILSTATNAVRRWWKTLKIVHVEFERCVITDAWFVLCFGLIIWRRQQQWCMSTMFHMRGLLKYRQQLFPVKMQQQYHFLVAVATVWFPFVFLILLICFSLSVFAWMFLAHNGYGIRFKGRTIALIEAAHLLIKHQWEQAVTAWRDAWDQFHNIFVSSSTSKSTSLIVNPVIIQKGLWSLTQLSGSPSKLTEYQMISALHFVSSPLSSCWY